MGKALVTAVTGNTMTVINTSGSTGNLISIPSIDEIAWRLERIEERLLILIPDPSKLAKYEALRRAYEEYKLMEALVK